MKIAKFYRDVADVARADAHNPETLTQLGSGLWTPQVRRKPVLLDASRVVAVIESDQLDAHAQHFVTEVRLSVGGSVYVSNPVERAFVIWMAAMDGQDGQIASDDDAPPVAESDDDEKVTPRETRLHDDGSGLDSETGNVIEGGPFAPHLVT